MKQTTQADGISMEGTGLQEYKVSLGEEWEIRLERHFGIRAWGNWGPRLWRKAGSQRTIERDRKLFRGEQYDSSSALVAVNLGREAMEQEDCWEAAASVYIREGGSFLPLLNISQLPVIETYLPY